MKTIILIFFLSLNLFAQSELLTLFSGAIVYNGTDLITGTINNDLEISSEIILNGSFAAGTNNWGQAFTIIKHYSSDWNSVGRTNILLDSATATSNARSNQNIADLTSGSRYLLSYLYYLPSSNTSSDGFLPVLNDGGGILNMTEQTTQNSWVSVKEYFTPSFNAGYLNFFFTTGGGVITGITVGDKHYFDDVSLKQASNYTTTGNHSFDTTTVYKQAGSYGGAIIASAGGNGTTNTISLASTLFTAVTNGTNYRFQLYAYTSTANTTLTFKLGDIVKTAIVPTTGMAVLNFDFKATASTTGNILLYLDKAATVYLDEVSLKSGS